MKMFKFEAGQTIIEVLIATTVVALVMTTVVAGMALSVRNTSQAKFKTIAIQLGQEGLESFRRQRDTMGWETFFSTLQTQGAARYCLNDLPDNDQELAALDAGACAAGMPLVGTEFRREAVLTLNGTNEVVVTMEISWVDGEITRISQLTQEFRQID